MNRSTTSTHTPVSSRPVVTQEWSLHAELTFSHDGLGSTSPARQPSSDSGVHTSCSWGSQPAAPISANSNISRQVLHPCYGFQRGNILFTTTPPSQIAHQSVPQQVQSPLQVASNYNAESSSIHCRAAPCRSPQPYNRRCKSTCSIVLSEVQEPPDTNNINTYPDASVNRGTSCSPVQRCYHTLTHRCGDPVCYHASCVTDSFLSKPSRHTMPASSVPETEETCEVCGGGRSPTALRRAARTNTFTTHFCTRVPERAHSFGAADKQTDEFVKKSKDAAIQTSDVPSNTEDKEDSKINKTTNSLQVPDEDLSFPVKRKSGKKLSRSPARLRGKSPLMQSRQNSICESRTSSPENVNRKPRTVHIDVYCTGSEDADASNTSDTPEEGESWSSPQTVFESDKLRVVHTRAGKNQLPQALQRQVSVQGQRHDVSYRSESFKCSPSERVQQYARGFDSDDGLSSHYPSKQSSYTTFQDTESSLPSDIQTTSRDPSSSTISSSSCALFSEDYDSIAATSWKDTITEIESVAQSNLSLALSDSFEYADAMDRLRIREKEKAWACSADEDTSKQVKTWQSPNTERKHLLQQQKFKEYLEKHHGTEGFPLWKPDATEDSEEEDDDEETGDAWVFNSGGEGIGSVKVSTIKRESTIRKAAGDIISDLDKIQIDQVNIENTSHLVGDSGSLSDSGPPTKHRFIRRSVIGPFGIKPPSPPPSKMGSVVTSPFTAIGRGTDQFFKAQKFGTIIGAFRKPGHHIGPARNPDCTCEHCREYYENIGRRGRARSVGDMPCAGRLEWKS